MEEQDHINNIHNRNILTIHLNIIISIPTQIITILRIRKHTNNIINTNTVNSRSEVNNNSNSRRNGNKWGGAARRQVNIRNTVISLSNHVII